MKKLGLMANYALAGMVLTGLAVCAALWYVVAAAWMAGSVIVGMASC